MNMVNYIRDRCRFGEQTAMDTCTLLVSWLDNGHDAVELAGTFCHRKCYVKFNNVSMRDRAEERHKTSLESGELSLFVTNI